MNGLQNCALLKNKDMKNAGKFIIWLVFTGLLVCNVFVFLRSIELSDEVNHYEREIAVLHQENLNLANKIYEVDSFQHASSLAAQLDFSKKAQPLFLDDLKYALNR